MNAVDQNLPAEAQEKPSNGIKGLKHIRHDIISGIVVSLVSLPLSSGIAIASGVPPVYGLTSAIIAGLLFPFLGGAYVTISGPAAGLAPALFAIMVTLGGAGNAKEVGQGYHFLLCVIFMVGCMQAVMALLKLARYCAIIPVSVVEGMLASIGLMIMIKQVSPFFGYTGAAKAKDFIHYLMLIPTYARESNVQVFAVSFATLAMLFWMGSMKNVKLLKVIPPQLIAVVMGVILGQMFHLDDLRDKNHEAWALITLPENPFHSMHMPPFAELLVRKDLWYYVFLGVVTLTLIDGVESLATAMAIDRIDPFRRKSQPNRLLFAMAISNIASSLIGGLTIIPGGVKSKANIASGGRTLWANFTNSICLIIYMVFARKLINLIPLGVLASVLIYTGWKMCEPLVWNHIAHIGKEQLGIFAFTIVATLATDLLIGIIAGTIAKLALNTLFHRRALGAGGLQEDQRPSLIQGMGGFFRNPVCQRELVGDQYHLYFDKPLVCFNSMHVSSELEKVPAEAKSVTIHLNPTVSLIDHTSCENLLSAVHEFTRNGVPAQVIGLDALQPRSEYHACVHVAAPSVAVAPAI